MVIDLDGVLDDGTLPDPTSPAGEDRHRTIRLALGQSATIQLRVTNPSGQPAQTDGATATLAVKRRAFDSPAISKSAAMAGNQATFALVPADTKLLETGHYVYDVWVQTSPTARDPVVPISAWVLADSVVPAP